MYITAQNYFAWASPTNCLRGRAMSGRTAGLTVIRTSLFNSTVMAEQDMPADFIKKKLQDSSASMHFT
jgi:hypothetical protein